MSGRRGLLGGLAALGMGAPWVRHAQPAVVAQQRAMVGEAVGYVGGGVPAPRAPSVDPALMRLFRRRMDAEWARRERLERRLHMTGGAVPGIAACRSWKPWFAAAVHQRWMEENLPPPREFERAAWRAVFGREMEEDDQRF